MSPARTGTLHHVERYIGSCLISASDGARQYVKKEGPGGGRYRHGPPGTVPALGPPPPHHQEYDHRQYPRNGGGAGWTAGLPLISMTASSNHRRGADKKRDKQGGGAVVIVGGEERSPLSRLAIHTQGAPLIQAGGGNRAAQHHKNGQTPSGPPRGGPSYNNRTQVKSHHHHHHPSKTDTKNNNQQQQAKDQQQQGGSDSLSVVSDESSGNSENTLPRIIKPRKRRKKDRKPAPPPPQPQPPPSAPARVDVDQVGVRRRENSSIVTLKPYTPLCYENYSPDATATPREEKETFSNRVPTVGDAVVEVPVPSAVDEPKREEVDDFGGGSGVSVSSCQCRYCDPAGVIWDVEQRCYSPFLTPPAAAVPAPVTLPSPPPTAPLRAVASGLEVSSEIVTSPNGHRDIEIKFFSASPPLPSPPDRSLPATPVTPPWPHQHYHHHLKHRVRHPIESDIWDYSRSFMPEE